MCVIILCVGALEPENFLLTREEGKGWVVRHSAESPEPRAPSGNAGRWGGGRCPVIRVSPPFPSLLFYKPPFSLAACPRPPHGQVSRHGGTIR